MLSEKSRQLSHNKREKFKLPSPVPKCRKRQFLCHCFACHQKSKCLFRNALKGKRRYFPISDHAKPGAVSHSFNFVSAVHLYIPARKPWKNPVCSSPYGRGAVHIIQEKISARLKDPIHFIYGILWMRIMMNAHIAGYDLVLLTKTSHTEKVC